MADYEAKLGCLPAVLLVLCIAIVAGMFIGIMAGIAGMVAGWFV